jgi:hypothetical protein
MDDSATSPRVVAVKQAALVILHPRNIHWLAGGTKNDLLRPPRHTQLLWRNTLAHWNTKR